MSLHVYVVITNLLRVQRIFLPADEDFQPLLIMDDVLPVDTLTPTWVILASLSVELY